MPYYESYCHKRYPILQRNTAQRSLDPKRRRYTSKGIDLYRWARIFNCRVLPPFIAFQKGRGMATDQSGAPVSTTGQSKVQRSMCCRVTLFASVKTNYIIF